MFEERGVGAIGGIEGFPHFAILSHFLLSIIPFWYNFSQILGVCILLVLGGS